jgi:hypothetical protein
LFTFRGALTDRSAVPWVKSQVTVSASLLDADWAGTIEVKVNTRATSKREVERDKRDLNLGMGSSPYLSMIIVNASSCLGAIITKERQRNLTEA